MEGRLSPKLKKSAKKSSEKSSKSTKPKLFSKPINPSSDPEQGEAKAKLRTSKDIFNRLKWDAASLDINVSDVYIGYKDRFLGICEVKFTDFNPCAEDGDIPYHRIYYFRGGGPPIAPFIGKDGEVRVREDNWPPNTVMYWDRETRLDLIFNSGETFSGSGRQLNGNHLQVIPEGYQPAPIYQYNATVEGWEVPEADDSRITTSDLKLLSLNVLYELYDDHICHPYRRWPYLVDFLEDSDADIIALQEVTTTFLSALESASWVQQKYFLTEISTVGKTIKPYGQIFLTKFPPHQLFHSEQHGKRFVIANFQVQDRRNPLYIANIHLKSNHKGDSSKLRQKQMKDLLGTYAQMDPKGVAEFIIVGDSNFTNQETIHQLNSKMQMVDVWEELMGESNDPGWTFDIYENSIAKQLSANARQERIDRIFKTANSNWLKSETILVSGKSQIDLSRPPRALQSPMKDLQVEPQELWLSDHYALEYKFRILPQELPESSDFAIEETTVDIVFAKPVSPQVSMSPVHTSAVVIIPPGSVWPRIQDIRCHFDPSFDRWPPHINLIYGFIPDIARNFAEAQATFAGILESEVPFPIQLSKVETFKHSSKSWTVYLTTSTSEEEKLKDLQLELEAVYPECKEQSNKSPSGFKPHLTIAKLTIGGDITRQRVTKMVDDWTSAFMAEPLEFQVDRIHLISRKANNPFRIKKTVSIGFEMEKSSYLQTFISSNNLLPSASRANEEAAGIYEINKLCETVTGEGATSVHVVGSSYMGFHDDTSDMDILLCGPPEMSHKVFFEALSSIYDSSSGNRKLELVSVVLDTLVPIARFRMVSLEIDVVYCPCGANNWNLSEQELRGQNETFIRSVDGIMESNRLFELIPSCWWPTYATSVRALKFWAKRRKISSKVMGYISSNTISLLLAKVILETGIPSKPSTPEELVAEFFDFYSFWKWPTPVTFHGSSSTPSLFPNKTPQLMPICSPSFPYLNRTRNMTKSTRMLIQKELTRGNEIFSAILETFDENWRSLCKVEDFFEKYPLYIKIDIKCDNGKDLTICDGILRSKLVNLVVDLEKTLGIFCQPYTEVLFPGNSALVAFIGCDALPSKELTNAIGIFKLKLDKWTTGFVSGKVELEVNDLRREDHSSDFDGFGITETDPIYNGNSPAPSDKVGTNADHKSDATVDGGSGYSKYSLKLLGAGCLILGTIIAVRRYWK